MNNSSQNNNTLPDTLSAFSCDMAVLKKIVSSVRNSAAGPDGFSMSIIKQIFHSICYPLLVIFQQSLHRGVFPTVWKALVSPRGGGGQLGEIAPPPTVIRSTPEIRANLKSLGGGGGEGDKRKAESNESNKNHRQLQL